MLKPKPLKKGTKSRVFSSLTFRYTKETQIRRTASYHTYSTSMSTSLLGSNYHLLASDGRCDVTYSVCQTHYRVYWCSFSSSHSTTYRYQSYLSLQSSSNTSSSCRYFCLFTLITSIRSM